MSLSLSFPACHFGKLYGLMMSMSAVFSLLQYPCFALVKGALGGDPFFVSAQESLTKGPLYEYHIFVDDTFRHMNTFRTLLLVSVHCDIVTDFCCVTGGRCSDCPLSAGVCPSCLRLHPLPESSPPEKGQRSD